MNIRPVILIGLVSMVLAACQKTEEPPKKYDDRLEKRYCNDPDAINYNWDFPGTPDNSICFFPDEIFNGTYKLTDSLFDGGFRFDTTSGRTFEITITSVDKVHMTVSGLVINSVCTLNNIKITGDRYYKASVDSTFSPPPDSTFLNGFVIPCSPDTISGFFAKDPDDISRLRVNFTIFGDTGIYFRRGTAIKL